jgi:hypothetical protein
VSSAMAVHTHALWTLECSSDIWAVNGDRLKRPHLQVMSCVPGWWDHDWLHVPWASVQPTESVLAVPRSLSKA